MLTIAYVISNDSLTPVQRGYREKESPGNSSLPLLWESPWPQAHEIRCPRRIGQRLAASPR